MDIKEMVAIVQLYIHLRKDVEVQINLQQFKNLMAIILLQNAYSVAVGWLNENNVKIHSNG